MPTFRAYNAKNADPTKDYTEQKGAIPAKLDVSVDYFEPTVGLIRLGCFLIYRNSSKNRSTGSLHDA